MVFLIDLPPLEEDASFSPTSFSTELFRFLRAIGLDDKLVSTLEKYDFSETKRYGFVHTMYASSRPVPLFLCYSELIRLFQCRLTLWK